MAAGLNWPPFHAMAEVRLNAYAKINLTLEVLDTRPDGFHEIDSVVQQIGLYDELVIGLASDGEIVVEVDDPSVPAGPENTVHKACRAFLDHTGIKSGVRCAIYKRIPAQAGLGGGSSDSAVVLTGLNRIFSAGLSPEALTKLAASIGSDVPFFIHGGTARMRGRGERIEALPDAPVLDIVVTKPDVAVSTAWAYAELDRTTIHPTIGASDAMQAAVVRGDRGSVIRGLQNSFDPAICAAVPAIAEAKRLLLQSGALSAMLCGSGSAVFGIFDSSGSAAEAAQWLNKQLPLAMATTTISREVS